MLNIFSNRSFFKNWNKTVSLIPAACTIPFKTGTRSTKNRIPSSSPKPAAITTCPSPSSELKVCCNRASSRPVIITLAPNFEHSMAVAFPIPEDAPVTNIVFPSNEYGL